MAEGLIVQTERPNPRSEQALTRGVVVPGRAPVLFAVGQQLCGLRNGGVWMPCLHPNKRGESKLLPSCSLPLTGVACVKRVVTNLAVLDIRDGAFHLVERAPGVTVEEIQAATAGTLVVPAEVPEMQI